MPNTTVTVISQNAHGEMTQTFTAPVAAYDIDDGQLTVRLADEKEVAVKEIHTFPAHRWLEVHLTLTETVN